MILLLLFVISEQAEACSFRDTGASCAPNHGQNSNPLTAVAMATIGLICGGTSPPCEACTNYTLEACTELCRLAM
jgi:hypothetical protein